MARKDVERGVTTEGVALRVVSQSYSVTQKWRSFFALPGCSNDADFAYDRNQSSGVSFSHVFQLQAQKENHTIPTPSHKSIENSPKAT